MLWLTWDAQNVKISHQTFSYFEMRAVNEMKIYSSIFEQIYCLKYSFGEYNSYLCENIC